MELFQEAPKRRIHLCLSPVRQNQTDRSTNLDRDQYDKLRSVSILSIAKHPPQHRLTTSHTNPNDNFQSQKQHPHQSGYKCPRSETLSELNPGGLPPPRPPGSGGCRSRNLFQTGGSCSHPVHRSKIRWFMLFSCRRSSAPVAAAGASCRSSSGVVLPFFVLWRPIDGQTYRRANLAKPCKLKGFARFAQR